jgi:hypothetical protein
MKLAQLLGGPALIWSHEERVDFLRAVTSKLKPSSFPGKLELEEGGRVRGWEFQVEGTAHVNTWK